MTAEQARRSDPLTRVLSRYEASGFSVHRSSTMIGACVIGAFVVAIGVLCLSDWLCRRHPWELRGNWWRQFERDFHAHVERGAKMATGDKQNRERRPPWL
jgi:hypothetical protein